MRAIPTTVIVSDPWLNGQIGRSLVSGAANAPEASIRQRDVSVDGSILSSAMLGAAG
jgi:hypothetical protein